MAEEEVVKALVQKQLTIWGASSTADFGKVMKEAVARAGGRADGKIISGIVKIFYPKVIFNWKIRFVQRGGFLVAQIASGRKVFNEFCFTLRQSRLGDF